MDKKSLSKSYKTRATTQRAQAKTMRQLAKGLNTSEAKKYRAKAHRLSELATNNLAKAKKIDAQLRDIAFRASRNKITVGEQEILDNLEQATTQPVIEATPSFNEVYVDTVRELIRSGRGMNVLNTPVAHAIDNWLDETIAEYGIDAVAYVCQKALDDNPYIFDQYIYDSDQSGMLTNDTLFILNSYADEYIENYSSKTFDENDLQIDDTIGTEGIYN